MLADVMSKGNVKRGESVDDARADLKWDAGDKERTLVILLKHIYGEAMDIDTVLAGIKEKFSE